MLVSDIAIRVVKIAFKETTIHEAASIMRSGHVGSLVVVEKGRGGMIPIGMVTDRDIVVEVIAEGIPLKKLCVGDIMSTDLITVDESMAVSEAVLVMEITGLKRLPVVDSAGILTGIIASDDALEYVAGFTSSLARVPREQRSYEREFRQ